MTITWIQKRLEKTHEMVRRHYFDRGWCHAYKHYEGLLARVLDKYSVVLDVGCGRQFPMAAFLAGLAGEVYGVDPVAAPTDSVCGAVIRRGTAERLPYADASIDVVTSRCVLEHLEDPAAVFKEFHRVLKPNGRVVFLTSNKYDYVSLGGMVIPNALHGRIIKTLEGRGEQDTFPTYYRANSARKIQRLAHESCFVVERLEHLNHYPYLLTFNPLLCRLVIAYDKLICRFRHLAWLQAWLLGSLRKAHREETRSRD